MIKLLTNESRLKEIQKIINRNKNLPLILDPLLIDSQSLSIKIHNDIIENIPKIKRKFESLWNTTHKNFEILIDDSYISLVHEKVLFSAENFDEFWFKYELYISGFIAGMYN